MADDSPHAGAEGFRTRAHRVCVRSREDLNFPRLTDYGGDRFGLRFTRGRHGGGECVHWLLSEDAGQTWMDDHGLAAWEGYHGTDFSLLRDGSLLGVIWDIRTPSVFGNHWGVVTSPDHGRTWTHTLEAAFGVEGRPDYIPWGYPLELPDGTVLMTGNGPIGMRDPDSQVFIFRRLPGETIWRRADKSIFGPQPDTIEGTNEAGLASLPDGKIACVVRTGYPDSPMLWAVSEDDARTWCEPVKLPWSGVDPRLYVMDGGTLVLIFGDRRADMLHGAMTAVASDDGGATWGTPFVFYDGPGSSYHTAVSIGPSSLLVCYAESMFRRREMPQFTPPGQYNRICAVELELPRPS